MTRKNDDYVRNILISVRKELLNEMEAVSDKQLNRTLSEDKWSVSQVIHHLIFIEEKILPVLKKAVQEESKPVMEKNLEFLLDRTNKLKSPFPEPSTEFISKEDLLKKLNDVRTPLLDYINEIDEMVIKEKSVMNPLLGPISIKQMIEFIALHERRHIGQIKELKESILSY
jgi:hypothetical protein